MAEEPLHLVREVGYRFPQPAQYELRVFRRDDRLSHRPDRRALPLLPPRPRRAVPFRVGGYGQGVSRRRRLLLGRLQFTVRRSSCVACLLQHLVDRQRGLQRRLGGAPTRRKRRRPHGMAGDPVGGLLDRHHQLRRLSGRRRVQRQAVPSRARRHRGQGQLPAVSHRLRRRRHERGRHLGLPVGDGRTAHCRQSLLQVSWDRHLLRRPLQRPGRRSQDRVGRGAHAVTEQLLDLLAGILLRRRRLRLRLRALGPGLR